ncbi:MAG TPA: hypothetical protein VGD80_31775, partial [Kofleriaceae bacterium]
AAASTATAAAAAAPTTAGAAATAAARAIVAGRLRADNTRHLGQGQGNGEQLAHDSASSNARAARIYPGLLVSPEIIEIARM